MLAAPPTEGLLLEVRHPVPAGMRQRFIPASQIDRAAQLIARLAPRVDVYTGVLLRTRRAGDHDACAASHLAFVEIDRLDALAQLARLPHKPSMVVASGSPGHAHCYWQLTAPVALDQLEQANRRLAQQLAGDLACVDATRILRPAGTLNHKHQPPALVTVLDYEPARRYELGELIAGLPDPPGRGPEAVTANARATCRGELDEQLLAIPAHQYVRALAGLQPNRAGKVNCPFHHDSTPSLQLYPDGSWCCFAPHGNEGRIGGTIYHFAGRLWGYDTKGPQFPELRARLAHELLGRH